jgi:hypothetical protein
MRIFRPWADPAGRTEVSRPPYHSEPAGPASFRYSDANPEFGAGVTKQRVADGVWEYTTGDTTRSFSQVFMWMAVLGFMVLV